MDSGKEEIERLLIHSGLFLIENGKPAGVFLLNRGNNCQPFKTKNRLRLGISDLAARVMVRKLRDVIYKCEHDQPDYSAFHRELKDSIEQSLLEFIENHNLQKEKLEPQYNRFFKKLLKLYKKQIIEDWGPKRVGSKANKKFYSLTLPIIMIFKKYLTNLETKKCEATDDYIFHYTSQVLVACGIEKSSKTRGHRPVYEKLKQFYIRHKADIKDSEQYRSRWRI